MENQIDQPRVALDANGQLAMTIPHRIYGGFDHTITLPCDENGLRLMRRILAARASGKVKIGQDGNPTQSVVELWLKNKSETDAITKREEDKKLDDAVLAEF